LNKEAETYYARREVEQKETKLTKVKEEAGIRERIYGNRSAPEFPLMLLSKIE
jgi:hypothetical protein